MYGFGPNSNDRKLREEPTTPWGFDPEGRPVFVVEQLPAMPVVEKIVIGADHLELNGWTFPYERLNKGFLQWFQGTLIAWAKSDPSASHRQWIDEICQTIQQRLRGEF
jgi:hypothetical protein